MQKTGDILSIGVPGMSINFNMHIPTHIVFGVGALNNLHKQDLPGKKALVIISNGKSARANGYLDRTLSELNKAGVEHVIFDKVMHQKRQL